MELFLNDIRALFFAIRDALLYALQMQQMQFWRCLLHARSMPETCSYFAFYFSDRRSQQIFRSTSHTGLLRASEGLFRVHELRALFEALLYGSLTFASLVREMIRACARFIMKV